MVTIQYHQFMVIPGIVYYCFTHIIALKSDVLL